MLAEWSAECSIDDPTLVVPWSDAASGLRFIDLRAEPYALSDLHEADAYPELARALRALNATRSPLLTAKCDVWLLSAPADDEELQALALELSLPEEAALHGIGSYIDCLWRDVPLFTSAGQQQLLLDRLVRRLERLHHPQCAANCVLRPAMLDFNGPLEGFALTVYLRAVDSAAATARGLWADALEAVVNTLRVRAPGAVPGSATIEDAAAFPLRTRHFGAESK